MKRIVVFVLCVVPILFVCGCFDDDKRVADYQVPDTFTYSITGTTDGIGDRSVTFTNNLRKAVTDSGIYRAVTMRVKIYNYDTATLGEPIAVIVPSVVDGKIVCSTSEADEAVLKSCKQVLVKIEATRGTNTITILEAVHYNGFSRSGPTEIKLDFFTYTKSLVYKAWHALHPEGDYADFTHNLIKDNTYIDLAVVGIKEAIADWNNFEYLEVYNNWSVSMGIAADMTSEKCFNMYCLKIPQLDAGGVFSGIRCQDIYVQVLGLDGKIISQKVLAPDGSFSFSLPSRSIYGIKVISGLSEKWLATDLVGNARVLNADLQLFEGDFLVR